jgi:hypothetical protein
MSLSTWTTAWQKIDEYERTGGAARYNKFGTRIPSVEEKSAQRARTLLNLLNKATVPEPAVERVEDALKLVWFTREGGVVRHAQVYFKKSGGYEFYYDVRDSGNPSNNVSNFDDAGDKYRDQSEDKVAEKLAVISDVLNTLVFPSKK